MFDISKIKQTIIPRSRYITQIDRILANGKGVVCIEQTVTCCINNIKENNRSFVIYGEPQSGKTEMMICLTAKLLDEKHKIVVLLLNDNVELLNQNLNRFIKSNLAPIPKNYTEVLEPTVTIGKSDWIIFCKKNSGDLKKLIDKIISPIFNFLSPSSFFINFNDIIKKNIGICKYYNT